VALHAAARAKDAPLCALLVAHGAQLNHAQLCAQATQAEVIDASEPDRFPDIGVSASSSSTGQKKRPRLAGGGAHLSDSDDNNESEEGEERYGMSGNSSVLELSVPSSPAAARENLDQIHPVTNGSRSARPNIFLYDLVPTSAFLRYVLKAVPQPPLPVLVSASDSCLSCHKPFNGVRLPRTCHFCARLLCSACSSLCAPSTAFPHSFLSHNDEIGSLDSHEDHSIAFPVASSSKAAEPATGVVQVKEGALQNSVCEDCHAVLSVSSPGVVGSPQRPGNWLSSR